MTFTPWFTESTTLKNDAVSKNNIQEAALQIACDYYSSKLDIIAKAYGKTSPQGKQLLKLRSDSHCGPSAPTPPMPGT